MVTGSIEWFIIAERCCFIEAKDGGYFVALEQKVGRLCNVTTGLPSEKVLVWLSGAADLADWSQRSGQEHRWRVST